jgi:uncharacterized protein
MTQLLLTCALMLLAPASPAATSAAPDAIATVTLSGIPLDSPWKARVYGFARERLLHPAWGWTHSERDYQLAVEIAAEEGFAIDRDVLFAAAFTHDIGAIGDFQKAGVDHAERSVELAEPMLNEAGFPMAKWPAVRSAILGHMHDKPAGEGNAGIVLHDADTLDFLGTVGVARRLSVTGIGTDSSVGIARIRDFADQLAERLVTATAKAKAAPRIMEMRRFLAEWESETFGGRLP